MNHGPLIFFGLLLSMALSWYGMVVVPQLQIGRQTQITIEPAMVRYPVQRPGHAEEGKQVYRANGCYYCHTQAVRAEAKFDLVLAKAEPASTNLIDALMEVKPGLNREGARQLIDSMPSVVLESVDRSTTQNAVRILTAADAQANPVLSYEGADIERGWGLRPSVAQDYLYDRPVMLGDLRLGPDLTNVGARLPDENWHLIHLYNPQTVVEGSSMPAYPYLFRKQKIGRQPSPDALRLTGRFAPEQGYEIVPTPEAKALAAYLLSLKTEMPLFEAPVPSAPAAPDAGTGTNQTADTLSAGRHQLALQLQ